MIPDDPKRRSPFDLSDDANPAPSEPALKATWDVLGTAHDPVATPADVQQAAAQFWDRVDASTANPTAAPDRSAAPARHRVTSRHWIGGAILAFAFMALGFGIGQWRTPDMVAPQTDPAFLVLIRGGTFAERSPEEQAEIVEAFRVWAQQLHARNHLQASNQLSEQGHTLVRLASDIVEEPLIRAPDYVGGYFVITAPSYADALALARACPHLDYGGTVEVRPIISHP